MIKKRRLKEAMSAIKKVANGVKIANAPCNVKITTAKENPTNKHAMRHNKSDQN